MGVMVIHTAMARALVGVMRWRRAAARQVEGEM